MDAYRLLLVLSIISSASASATAAAVNCGEKVRMDFYYETLCPYCSNLMVNYLYKIFESDLITITDLKLYPYGNAKIKSDGSIVCQHGEYECLLNFVEACAIDTWPDVNDHFPFIYCIESLVYNNNYTKWESCFEKLNLDASPVLSCLTSERGKELELQYAAQTNALQPPHTYVPWVVVDGQPLYDDYRNYASYICKAYKGTPKPAACSASLAGRIRKVKMDLHTSLFGEESFKSKLSRMVPALLPWLQ